MLGIVTPQAASNFARSGVVLHVLEARQAVRDGPHVAAALDVVLAAKRVEAAAVAADMPGQQRQHDEREHVVDGVVVLGDAERPADHRALGRGERVGELADRARGHAGLALGPFERAGLDRVAVGLEAARGAVDELPVREAGRDDLPPDRVRERDVRAHVETEPQVGPLGRARAARIDRDEARASADPPQDVVEEDRMRLPGIAAPEDDQVGLFRLTI